MRDGKRERLELAICDLERPRAVGDASLEAVEDLTVVDRERRAVGEIFDEIEVVGCVGRPIGAGPEQRQVAEVHAARTQAHDDHPADADLLEDGDEPGSERLFELLEIELGLVVGLTSREHVARDAFTQFQRRLVVEVSEILVDGWIGVIRRDRNQRVAFEQSNVCGFPYELREPARDHSEKPLEIRARLREELRRFGERLQSIRLSFRL